MHKVILKPKNCNFLVRAQVFNLYNQMFFVNVRSELNQKYNWNLSL